MTPPPPTRTPSVATDDRADLEAATGDLVVQAARLVRAVRRLDHRVPPAGLRTLSVLDEHGPLPVGRLADLDRVSQPAASSVVAGLDERGWAERVADPSDGRARVVRLTDAGREVLADARRQHARAVAAGLGPDDTPAVLAATRLVRDLLATDLSPPADD